ncbi:HAD family hydrolase [Paenibacillus allorhizosphaerae]|uniref:HAD family phosphatase n=1 Tax=Paenibacillus allorhizosphaerae TaxID=2849866 RepID=A0ABM8VDF2_9BACL|nr:HAD family hydrolase [Paenibacillus allorhizosphaerae]CAG7627344.1 hypothetical protein PAECIP111802_01343 [Paenibacillus allorhizosphaerae]
MKLSLVAVDLDGTLLGGTSGRYGFLPAGVEALRLAARQQAIVAIATGRDLPFILELLEREKVNPVVESWPQVIVSEERCIHYLNDGMVYVPDAEWNDKILQAERSRFDAILQGVNELLAGELAAIDPSASRVMGEVEQRRGFVEIRFGSADAARSSEAVLSAWLRSHKLPYTAVRNVAGIAIRHASAGKGPVLLEVCRKLGIAPPELLAIGDSCNDLSMLDGRLGFAAAVPGNAESEVKAAVQAIGGYIANGRFGEGVAEAVNRALTDPPFAAGGKAG